ncbi:single-stranded DNA-binding protein [Salsuginibacillus kocurii]|uniref:single-stranded DNA-binding protein n=1 Tax=Salsuginibacillus kocurii TaxID=427078 RepID=UPI00037AE8CD|nr:single-stranded DNA-binding protein [Salsuginibacillus kocurii]
MINRVVLVGRLTRDPELRYTPNGVAVCNFGIAVNRTFTNQHGEREADFFNCVVWRKQAENVANYLKKGSQAGIDGRLQSRSYENNEGRRVTVVEVVGDSVQFLEPRGGSGTANNDPYGAPSQETSGGGYGGQQDSQSLKNDPFADQGKAIDISDDDLPF